MANTTVLKRRIRTRSKEHGALRVWLFAHCSLLTAQPACFFVMANTTTLKRHTKLTGTRLSKV